MLSLLENFLLFHPLKAGQDWVPPPDDRVEDVSLGGGGPYLHAWWCPPAGWTPERGVVLFCHGNAGNLSHRGHQVPAWQQATDSAVLLFDYPGYGRCGGSPSEKGCYAAADAAYNWLTHQKEVPPERILLFGESLGGGVAVELATRRPHRALVLLSAFTSVPDMGQQIYPWLPVRWLVRNRFESLEKIGRVEGPVFIAHGTADSIVPYGHGERLFAAAREPKRFLPLEGWDHNDLVRPEFYTTLRDWLTQVEAEAPAGK